MKTCGTGVSLRSRECLTGANCRGTGTETRKCKIQDCPCKWQFAKQFSVLRSPRVHIRLIRENPIEGWCEISASSPKQYLFQISF